MKIIAAATDPGGTESIAPVIKELLLQNNDVIVLAAKYSKKVFDKHSIKYLDGDRFLNESKLLNFLESERPDVILTSTSIGWSIEKAIILCARKLRIKTISVIDFWINYKTRFSKEDDDLSILPDKICIMDDSALKEMVAEGFQKEILTVTGNPQFDATILLREKLPVKSTKTKVITYFSQPVEMVFGNESSPRYMGYTEMDVAKDIFEALDELIKEIPLTFVFGPHPKETEEKFESIVSKRPYAKFNRNANFRDAIIESDLVLGMFSMALFEASLLGKTVISYQPNLLVKDSLKSNELGWSKLITEKSKLKAEIKKALSKPSSGLPRLGKAFDGHSTQRVIDQIKELVLHKA